MAALFGAGLAADTCAVVCLIILRATVIALCATYYKKMSGEKAMFGHDENGVETSADAFKVAELKRQLPTARSSVERFSLFLEHVERLFPFLTHASIFLLPKDLMSHSSHQHTFSFSSGKLPITTNPKSTPKLPMSASFTDPDDAIRQFVEKVLAFRSSNNLDWNNCCTFNLYKGRGPVVQSQPQWPVSCAASYHAGVIIADIISTGDYAKHGPHFLDWKALHEKGAKSMIAVPMYSCKQVIAVLSLASNVTNAFERKGVAGQMGAVVAPYAEMLKYTTRRMEMQKIVNEIINPIEPYLRQKRGLQYPHNQATHQCQQVGAEVLSHADDSSLEEGNSGQEEEGGKRVSGDLGKAGKKIDKVAAPSGAMPSTLIPSTTAKCDAPVSRFKANEAKGTPHEKTAIKRKQPGISKHHALDIDSFGTQDPDLDWGDFFFNLVSMIIVYIYFSKVAVKGETVIAILLCIGVAALDVVLLLMRWLWFEHYIHYGVVLHVFQIYRVFVVPVANTWMSWRVLHNMNIQAELHVIVLLGVLLLLCMLLGIQVRFLFQAPLQLVSILFTSLTIPGLCGYEAGRDQPGISCIGAASAMQFAMGFALPTIVMQLQDQSARLRECMPFAHGQLKKKLL